MVWIIGILNLEIVRYLVLGLLPLQKFNITELSHKMFISFLVNREKV